MLALTGQKAEHEFVGAKVGIMDQFISALGKKGHALLIDCRSLEAEQIPFAAAGDTIVVICDTKVKHELSGSEYNTRRTECEHGVEILQRFIPGIEQLRDVSVEEFEKHSVHLPEVIKKRCRHVVTENARTLKAAEALKKGAFLEFGRLMQLSHKSLRFDYEVSSRELDLLVDIATGCKGVLGARMTGGGFGGSTVNLVHRENLDAFKEKISAEYLRETQIQTDIYVSTPAEGAGEVST
jgi:galactokinase